MANLNLSQFGENTSVSDADYTFVWDTAASISKKVSRNSWLNSGTLTSDAPVTISQTWGNSGQTFKAFVVNAAGTSGTNSASGSLLADFQVGGVSLAAINKNGQVIGSTSTVLLNLNSDTYIRNGNAGRAASLWAAECRIVGGPLVFSDSVNVNASDISLGVALHKESANTLALRNGAAAQTFRVYNTFPGTGNNEFGTLNWVDQPNEFQIATGQAGSGTGRALCLRSGGGINIRIGGAPGTLVWQFGTSTGHFLAATDNSVDIGASGANRPRNVYAAGLIKASGTGSQSSVEITGGAGTASIYFYPNSASVTGSITNPSDGVLRISDGAGTSFNRLQFGGTTDAFPAIARDGAGIKFTGAAAGSTAWIKVPPVAVSALPLAATAGAGARAFVNDASSPTFGSAVTGGGAVLVPVYSTGSAWHVG